MRRRRPFPSPEDVMAVGLFWGITLLLLAVCTNLSPLWLPAVPCFAVAGYAWLRLERRGTEDDRRDTGRCVACGYDLRGNVSGVCPECGAKLEEGPRPER